MWTFCNILISCQARDMTVRFWYYFVVVGINKCKCISTLLMSPDQIKSSLIIWHSAWSNSIGKNKNCVHFDERWHQSRRARTTIIWYASVTLAIEASHVCMCLYGLLRTTTKNNSNKITTFRFFQHINCAHDSESE